MKLKEKGDCELNSFDIPEGALMPFFNGMMLFDRLPTIKLLAHSLYEGEKKQWVF